MTEVETTLVTETQNAEDPILNATIALAIAMIGDNRINNQIEITEFCEHVYPSLKQLQQPKV